MKRCGPVGNHGQRGGRGTEVFHDHVPVGVDRQLDVRVPLVVEADFVLALAKEAVFDT